MTQEDTSKKWTPDEAFCLNKIWPGWITPLVLRGNKHTLTGDDLYGTPQMFDMQKLNEEVEAVCRGSPCGRCGRQCA